MFLEITKVLKVENLRKSLGERFLIHAQNVQVMTKNKNQKSLLLRSLVTTSITSEKK